MLIVHPHLFRSLLWKFIKPSQSQARHSKQLRYRGQTYSKIEMMRRLMSCMLLSKRVDLRNHRARQPANDPFTRLPRTGNRHH